MYERTYQKKVQGQNAPEESGAKKRPRRRRRRIRRMLKGALAGLVAILVVILIRLPQLQVRTVDVSGTSVVDPEDVSQFIQSKIEGNFLYVFPKKSMLLVPTASIAKWTARQFPRLATVDVRRKGVHGLIVTVTEHEGKYLWCEGEGSDNPACYFMTENGLVFAQAPFFSGNAYVKIYIGSNGELPFSPLAPDQLSMIKLLLDRLPSLGINPSAFQMVSEHELDVVFPHAAGDARLLLDPGNDTAQTLENLATALATDPLKSEFNSPAKSLDYLDARFANKVVYKFK